MNNSNAAAKKRRAGIQPSIPPEPTPSTRSASANSSNSGLTLPQVIALIDKRLVTLETFMNDTKNTDMTVTDDNQETGIVMDSKEFSSFVDEINHRFQVLADEINLLKDTVLKLQGYTMDVNKVLLSEITKNEEGTMPQITLDDDGAKFVLESMVADTENNNN